MSVLDKKAMYDLKWNYNYNLNRYYNGCNYISANGENADKYYNELFDILDNLNLLLKEIMKEEDITENEILNGFKINKKKEEW